jgi:hypothetical protein
MAAAGTALDLHREVTLRTTISQRDRHADLTDYVVLVQTEGGLAEQVTLSVSARRPAEWTSYPEICAPHGRTPSVECPLGDVNGSASVQLVLRLPTAFKMAEAIRVVAVTQAANVAVRSVATTKLEYTAVGAAGQTVPSVPGTGTPTPATTHTRYQSYSAPGQPQPLPRAQPPLPVRQPAPVQHYQQPVPAPNPIQTAPEVQVSAPPSTQQPSAPNPIQTAPQVEMSAAPPVQALVMPPPPVRLPDPVRRSQRPSAALMPVQTAPQTQPPGASPGTLPASPKPSVPASPVPTPQVLPLPGITPALTSAPQPSRPPAISMLTTAESEKRVHSPWAPVLGIAVVSEVAQLWLATCLGIWCRKLMLSGGQTLPHPVGALTVIGRGLRRARLRFRRRP